MMDTPARFLRRLRHWLRFSARQDDIRDEIEFHTAMVERELLDRGYSPNSARYEARRRMGNATMMREDARAVWITTKLEAVMQDVKYAVRALRRTPALTAGIMITFALGIGVYSAAFSMIDRLMFRPPPSLIDPSSVHRVRFYRNNNERGEQETWVPHIRYAEIASSIARFSNVAAFASQPIAIGKGVAIRRVNAAEVTPSFFGFFDATPAAGRYFIDGENLTPAGTPVVVLSHAMWTSEYGASRTALGQQLTVGGVDHTIIGVAPKHFVGVTPDQPPAIFIPLASYGAMRAPVRWYTSYGNGIGIQVLVRRKPDVSIDAADAELSFAFNRSWRTEMEQRRGAGGTAPPNMKLRAIASPLLADRGPRRSATGTMALWLSGVSLIVLVIACANVANLLLARAWDRRREMAVRVALGVGRARLISQLLVESLALAIGGGAVGLLVGQVVNTLVRSSLLPDAASTSILGDARTILIAAAATLTIGLIAGLAPLLQAGRVDPMEFLRSGRSQAGSARSVVRSTLLITQVTLSVALLVGAGLFVRSWQHARGVRLGFEPDAVLSVSMSFGVPLDSASVVSLRERLVATAKTMPEVTHATLRESIPFGGMSGYPLRIAGIDSVDALGRFDMNAVGADYFTTVGTRIVRGRGIDAGDVNGAAPVAVVSAAMAERVWPGKDAIGQCMVVDETPGCRQVVGIAEDIKTLGLAGEQEYYYYLPSLQFRPQEGGIFVRTRGDAPRYAESVRRALQGEMPANSYVTVAPLSDGIARRRRSWDAGAKIFTALGALCAILSAVGLYSLLANDVARRRRELGVRIALGANAGRVASRVAMRGLVLTSVGAALGCAIAVASARWVGPLLFQQSPRDPIVYGAVVAVVLVVALAASFVPALRAASADPRVALQDE
ncbi:MAG TPA: ADOP family duplicated permease [Gemmatimonadaceae bacterium]|nr:ADOP family duplicated permease [Gemmatimonadaceae bacterium]